LQVSRSAKHTTEDNLHPAPFQPASVSATPLVAGRASGEVVVLDEPLSFWGGFDSAAGRITDRHHPQIGTSLTRRVLVMPSGRGSSSSSSVLAEAIRAGTAPMAIILREADLIVALGALVAAELYERHVPVVVIAPGDYGALQTGQIIEVMAEGAQARIVWADKGQA
jgi:predicted aconitase with swiveling domain